jgi:hypothetical protein
MMYDHMATLTEEINFIWRRPKALSAIAFLVNRYFALLGNIYGLFFTFMPIPEQVRSFHHVRGTLTTYLRRGLNF